MIEPALAARDPDGDEAAQCVLRAVVAIPVCNEAERIGACLLALHGQTGMPPGSFGVVLFLNNCTDGTAELVASLLPRLAIPVRVVERDRADGTAGWARREAMEAAADWLCESGMPDGVILTTDADSRVGPDWVARNLAEIAAGADAVAGRIALDPADAARLPSALHARGRLEAAYEALLTELSARLDPEDHNPWPCHWTRSGASLAVTLAAYRHVGGMPALAVGEDRAFIANLHAQDARVRHAPEIEVITSGRLDGRAPGGAADTMRLRCDEPESPCDPRLEALPRALHRILWHRRLRRLHAERRLHEIGRWAPLLAIPTGEAETIAHMPCVGGMLAAVEHASPRLAFHPLRPRQLPAQIRRARLLLLLIRSIGPLRLSGRRADTGRCDPDAAPARTQPTPG